MENVTYLHLDRVYESIYASGEDPINFVEMGKINPWMTLAVLTQLILKTFDGAQKSSGYQQLLNYPENFKFDLVIYDFIATPFLLGFMHKYGNPPLIGLTGYNAISMTSVILGSPYHPSLVAHHCRMESYNSFLRRVENYLLHWVDHTIRKYLVLPKIQTGLEKDFPGLPPVAQLEESARLALVNYHPVFEPSEPMLPNVIGIAGLQIQEPKRLPKDLKEIADQRSFVFFSLGTNTQPEMLGEQRIKHIVGAFRELSQFTIFWKVKGNLPLEVPPNLVIRPWFPQSDLLAHPNAKLFISHCGLLSTHEATWRAVPILGVPIILDQFMNAANSVKAGMALEYDIRNVTKDTFKSTILELITNSTYKKNALLRSKMFRDHPEKPLDRAIWWIEYVLRNPNENIFRSEALSLNIFQKHDGDIVVFLSCVVFLCLYITFKILRVIVRRIKVSSQRKKTKYE
ncbi:UDP-glycosyltransferase UGT4-like isoform X2 [Phlebotomus papatasi]|uniref:UDP-glycosyltransferase UGT4-like isoform X2 n=1 Tax=Phlebotomus papatasi TaxID=29031 RepID=UPI00248334DE|nr:UDP-glycosyltransferase UGT4-like isoform X2 [Phlebotomus papatasi]